MVVTTRAAVVGGGSWSFWPVEVGEVRLASRDEGVLRSETRRGGRPSARGRCRSSWSRRRRSGTRRGGQRPRRAARLEPSPKPCRQVNEGQGPSRAGRREPVPGRRRRVRARGLWQQPCSSTASPPDPSRSASIPRRPRQVAASSSGSPRRHPQVRRIDRWLGQVGSGTQTSPRLAMRRLEALPHRARAPGRRPTATRARGTPAQHERAAWRRGTPCPPPARRRSWWSPRPRCAARPRARRA
jgi:hypothetical protein